jgi:hypothetical protein
MYSRETAFFTLEAEDIARRNEGNLTPKAKGRHGSPKGIVRKGDIDKASIHDNKRRINPA